MFERPLFPVALDLNGRMCIVIGGHGDAEAMRRREQLEACGAIVRGCEPDVFDCAAGEAFLVLSTVRDAERNARFATLARQRGFLLWCIDQPQFGPMTMMAIASAGPLRIATTTSGTAPSIAGAFRAGLERAMDAKIERFVATLGALRRSLRARLPAPDDGPARMKAMARAARGFRVNVSFDYPAWFESAESE
jgi:siroheme synthase (precorrin-2 oxidase/ferrochelatase)